MADIEEIWKKLEKSSSGRTSRNLSGKENIIPEAAEYAVQNGFENIERKGFKGQEEKVKFITASQGSMESAETLDSDPFDQGNDDRGIDQEVESINMSREMSMEFSLSRYDVNVRHFQQAFHGADHSGLQSGEENVSPSQEYDDDFEDDIDDENVAMEQNLHAGEFVTKSADNFVHYSGEVTHADDAGSGHVICDCEDCINQTQVVDCLCENCILARDRTIDVPQSEEEVTCYCEDCVEHWQDPDYVCECEQCVNGLQQDFVLKNSKEKDVHMCQCEDCLQKTGSDVEMCSCEKCVNLEHTNDKPVWSHDLEGGQRSPPSGSSQDYQHFELKPGENADQSDRSFESGTDRSFRSDRTKGSHSDASFRSKGSNLDHSDASDGNYSLIEILGNVQLNSSNELHDHAYINPDKETSLCSDVDCQHCSHNITQDSPRSQDLHDVDDVFEHEHGGACACSVHVVDGPLARHRMSSPLQCHVDTDLLLEQQLQKTETELKQTKTDYEKEVKELRTENDKQNKLIQKCQKGKHRRCLSLTPDAKIEATMQHEITRLTAENLDLREEIDKQAEQIRKLKKMLKVYAKRMKEGEAAEIQAELEREEAKSVENVAQIKHRERNYMGMLEYKKDDEPQLIKVMILDLKPKVASGLLPGLPAYLLFMCVRHTDYINDDEKVRSFLTSTINGIKKVVKKHHDDLERVTLWLANTCRFLHTLKQYSGEKQFQNENTPRQNEHCLRNFDLSEYRQVFSDLAVWIYQTLIKLLEATIQPSIVAAVLEHEAIAGLTGSKPSGLRGRTSSRTEDTPEHSLDSLMKSMNMFVRVLTQHAVDPELIKQIFRQLYYFLGASALNNLLLRKDMCNWSKGMQIRYNLSHLEQWLRDNKLQESGAGNTLEPIVQASQLLQARKTDADVDSVYEMCSRLTAAQIVKILNLYTPVDEFEERVPISFIRKIQQKLKERQTVENALLMDLKFSFSVTFPFNPSKIALETIEVPEQMHLDKLVTRL